MEHITYKDHVIAISQDDCGMNPRTEMDNLGTMVMFHKRYALGDKHSYNMDDYTSWEGMKKDIIRKEDPAVILQVYMYDHSGITLKIGSFKGLLPEGHAEFDSGCVGFIFISKEKARKEYGWKAITKARKEQLEKYLSNEVDTYSQYVNGDIYQYSIKNADGEDIEDGSSSGYFGCDHEKSGLLGEAKSAIDCEIDH